ncbi:MAG: hypothetical protein ACRD0H_24530, partial [Actinomycetes bacterium]
MRTGKSLPGWKKPAHYRKWPTRLSRAARRIGLSAALVVILAACGVRPSAVINGGPAPSGPVVPERSTVVVLYFVLGDRPTAAQRQGVSTSPSDVLALLAAGPDQSERAAGLTTEVPGNAAPASVSLVPGDVTVAL